MSSCMWLEDEKQVKGIHTFLFPPVIVTFTKRRVYVILFLARPLGVFFFSCGSTCTIIKSACLPGLHSSHEGKEPLWSLEGSGLCQAEVLPICRYAKPLKKGEIYLGSLRLDFTSTRERAVDFTHDCGSSSFDGGGAEFSLLELEGASVIN